MSRITAMHMPNVWAFAFMSDTTEVTIFRSVPGDTTPRIQMRAPGRQAVAFPIERPERFGRWSTKAELRTFTENFQAGREIASI